MIHFVCLLVGLFLSFAAVENCIIAQFQNKIKYKNKSGELRF